MKQPKKVTPVSPDVPAPPSAPGGVTRLRYLGQGTRTVFTPIPHIAKCEIEGTYLFGPDGEIPTEWGQMLLEIAPELWVELDADGQPIRPAVLPAPALREAEPDTRARKYVNRGLAVLARNRYFPGCTVVQGADGLFNVVDAPKPKPIAEVDEYTDLEREEFASDANPGA